MKITKQIFKIIALSLFIGFASCDNDDDTTKPEQEEEEVVEGTYNIWVQVGASPDYSQFIREVSQNDIKDQTKVLSVEGQGADITGKLPYGVIEKNGYYYTVSRDARLGKYHVEDDAFVIDQEVPFTQLYNNYAHIWRDDNTLILIGPDGENHNLVYAVVDVTTMAVTNGVLNMPAIPEGFDVIGTSIAQFNSDKILLGYHYQDYANETYNYHSGIKIAVLNAETFAVEKTITDDRADIFGQTRYGDLYQPRALQTENGDIYFLTSDRGEEDKPSYILRILNGTTEIDASYEGFKSLDNSILGLWYLGNGKAIVQKYDVDWILEVFVFDLESGDLTALAVPADGASYTDNITVNIEEGKAYIVTNQEATGDGYVWVYDIASGSLTKGMTIPDGYEYILRIDYMHPRDQ